MTDQPNGFVQVVPDNEDVIIRRFDTGDMYYDANRSIYVCPTDEVAIPVNDLAAVVEELRAILRTRGIPVPSIFNVTLDLSRVDTADADTTLRYVKEAFAEVLREANDTTPPNDQISEMVDRILYGKDTRHMKASFTRGFEERMAQRDVIDAMCERLLNIKYSLYPSDPFEWAREGFVRLTFKEPPPGIAPEALAGLQYAHAVAFREVFNRLVSDGKNWTLTTEPPNTMIYRRPQQS